MSLLPRNQVRIALSPHCVSLVRKRTGWRPAILNKVTVTCPDVGGEPWAGPLAALEDVLQQEPPESAETVVVLSNHFVRYRVVPWSDLMLQRDEQVAYLHHSFKETYGEAALHYELRCAPETPGRPRLASAVERVLLQRLKEIVSRSTLRLRSVQPYLMSAYNQFSGRRGAQDGWFALVEPGRICVLGRGEGRWQCVKNVRAGADLTRELGATLAREHLNDNSGTIPAQVYLWAPESAHCAFALAAPWKVVPIKMETLAGFSAVADASLSMAAYG